MSTMNVDTLPPTMLVRIHPFNPSRGNVRRTMIIHGLGTAFEEAKGWYEVDTRIAVQLTKFRNNDQDPNSAKVFQIVTKEEAMRLDQRGVAKAAEAKSPIRVATNPLQSRQSIPKPVVLPKADAPAPPKAGTATRRAPEPTPAPELEEGSVGEETLAALHDDAFDGNGLDADMIGASGGDLTTEDLVGTVSKPKKLLGDDDEAAPAELPPPVQIPEDVKKAVAAKAAAAAAKKKR